jgi:peptidoglycan/xylan/chitin deacetylase (PgdA/CDA1 family)
VRPSPLVAARRALLAVKGRALLGGAVMIGPARPEVALTFDDGPSLAHTPAILEILRARGARATFFVLGRHVEEHPGLAREVAAEHEIGCHSYAHGREVARSVDAFRADLDRCRDVLGRELGLWPAYYRFPWGDPGVVGPRGARAAGGLATVHWSVSLDEQRGADAIVAGLERRLDPGAIVLLHDGLAPGSVYPVPRDETVRALPRILDRLEARGLRAVTLRELLG